MAIIDFYVQYENVRTSKWHLSYPYPYLSAISISFDSAVMDWFRWTEGTPSISGAKKMHGPAPCTADCAAATDKLRSEVERLRAEVARLRAAAATPATLLGGAAAAPEVVPADRADTGPSKVECLSVGINYGRRILPCLLHQTVTDLKGESVRMTMRDGKTFCGVIHALNLDDSALPEKQRNKIVLSLPQSQHKLFISTEKVSSVDAGSDSTHIANMSRSAWKKVGAVGKGHADKDKDKDKDKDSHKSSSSSIENNATDGRSDSSIGSGSDSRKKNSGLGSSGPSPVPVSPSSSSSSANSSSSSASSSGMKRVRGGSKAALLVEVKKEGKVARTASNSFDLSDSDNDLVVRATSSAVDLCDTSDGEEEEEEDGPMVLL